GDTARPRLSLAGQPPDIVENSHPAPLDFLPVGDESMGKVLADRMNSCQWRPEFVGNACDKFHLFPGQLLRPPRVEDDQQHAPRQQKQYSKTDGKVLEPQPGDRSLNRARPVLYHNAPVGLFTWRVAVNRRAQNSEGLIARRTGDQLISRRLVNDAVYTSSAFQHGDVVVESSIRSELDERRNEYILNVVRIELDDCKA